MNPVPNVHTNLTLMLPGGTKENDLPVEVQQDTERGAPVMVSVWELTDDERAAIACGAHIRLGIWGKGHPPVSLRVSDKNGDEVNAHGEVIQ